jgi:hypothetical protein
MIPAILLGRWITGSTIGEAIGAAVGVVLLFLSLNVLMFTQCTRCRDQLFIGKTDWMWKNPLASRCLNCGLSLSTWPTDPARPEASDRPSPHGRDGAA